MVRWLMVRVLLLSEIICFRLMEIFRLFRKKLLWSEVSFLLFSIDVGKIVFVFVIDVILVEIIISSVD